MDVPALVMCACRRGATSPASQILEKSKIDQIARVRSEAACGKQEGGCANQQRVEPAYKDGKSKRHKIFNLQGDGDKEDKLQRTGKQKCKYD